MLQVISNQIEITQAQSQLRVILQRIPSQQINVKIGHLGASYPTIISYSTQYDIWHRTGDRFRGSGMASQIYRYWNVFGLSQPKPNSNVSITVEINIPVEGVYRRLGGAFLKDEKRNMFLGHRGRIGGGKKGIGLTKFRQHFGTRLTRVQDGTILADVYVIGKLNDLGFNQNLTDFINEVAALK